MNRIILLAMCLFTTNELAAFQCANSSFEYSADLSVLGKNEDNANYLLYDILVTDNCNTVLDSFDIAEIDSSDIKRFTAAFDSLYHTFKEISKSTSVIKDNYTENILMSDGLIISENFSYANPFTDQINHVVYAQLDRISIEVSKQVSDFAKRELYIQLSKWDDLSIKQFISNFSKLNEELNNISTSIDPLDADSLEVTIKSKMRELIQENFSDGLRYQENIEQTYRDIIDGYIVEEVINDLDNELKDILDQNVVEEELVSLYTELEDGALQITDQYESFMTDFYSGISAAQDQYISLSTRANIIVDTYTTTTEMLTVFSDESLSIAEKKKALAHMKYDGMEPHQKELIEIQKDILNVQGFFQEGVTNYFDGVEGVISLANKVGINDPVFKDAGELIQVGKEVYNLATNWSNPVAAFASAKSIMGFSGGMKADHSEARHREIMSSLNAIHKRLGLMDKKLDLLLEGQKQIIKNQQKIFDQLIQIRSQIQENHTETILKLEEIHNAILGTQDLIVVFRTLDLAKCEGWRSFAAPTGTDRRIDVSNSIFPSYSDILEFKNNASDFGECWSALNSIYTDRREFNPIYHLKYRTSNDFSKIWVNDVYTPIYSFIIDSDPVNYSAFSSLSQDEVFYQYSLPQTTISELITKLKSPIRETNIIRRSSSRYAESKNYFIEPLDPASVNLVARFAIDIHTMRIFFTQNEEFIDYPKMISEGEFHDYSIPLQGYQILSQILHLVDVAIAQQNMISSDITLSIIYNSYGGALPKQNKDLEKVFSQNITLRQNFITYALTENIRNMEDKLNNPFLEYNFAVSSRTESKIREFVHDSWELKKENDTWFVSIFGEYERLPSAHELFEGKLSYYPVLEELLDVRTLLIGELSKYEIFNNIGQSDIESFVQAKLYYSRYN